MDYKYDQLYDLFLVPQFWAISIDPNYKWVNVNKTGWCSTLIVLLICSSFSTENGHPLLIKPAQKIALESVNSPTCRHQNHTEQDFTGSIQPTCIPFNPSAGYGTIGPKDVISELKHFINSSSAICKWQMKGTFRLGTLKTKVICGYLQHELLQVSFHQEYFTSLNWLVYLRGDFNTN